MQKAREHGPTVIQFTVVAIKLLSDAVGGSYGHDCLLRTSTVRNTGPPRPIIVGIELVEPCNC